MFKTLLKFLPKNEIVDECSPKQGPMMIRYYLTPKILGLRLVIHQFLRSDNDRHYHDHPWNFISFILKGSYYEHVPFSQFYNSYYTNAYKLGSDTVLHYKRFSFLMRPKLWRHWVELPEFFKEISLYDLNGRVHIYEECWTLVLLWGKRRDWGFWTEAGWIKYDSYDCRGK